MQTLPGFRDFYPEDQALRRALFNRWAAVARAHSFVEVDAPHLEPLDLYRKKSGEEILGQVFSFEDRGGREVGLRPELTPSVARMVAARNRELKKPIRWFSIGSFFRFERPQKGRTREFAQFNCDLFGLSGEAADGEAIALLIELLRGAGLGSSDFAVRISDRGVWNTFLTEQGLSEDRLPELLQVIDKLGRDKEVVTAAKLKEIGLELAAVQAFIGTPGADDPVFAALRSNLKARGLDEFVVFDRSVVRGLAYYTGAVFEAFDRAGELRAIAGGGRYDGLLDKMSDGAVNLPAVGFAIGDVVIMEMLQRNAKASESLAADARRLLAPQVYMVIAAENRRSEALGLLSSLRRAGVTVDYAFEPAKVGKQFQTASDRGAEFAIVVGEEWPELSLKNLESREEEKTSAGNLLEVLAKRLKTH